MGNALQYSISYASLWKVFGKYFFFFIESTDIRDGHTSEPRNTSGSATMPCLPPELKPAPSTRLEARISQTEILKCYQDLSRVFKTPLHIFWAKTDPVSSSQLWRSVIWWFILTRIKMPGNIWLQNEWTLLFPPHPWSFFSPGSKRLAD